MNDQQDSPDRGIVELNSTYLEQPTYPWISIGYHLQDDGSLRLVKELVYQDGKRETMNE